ncbi:hypothetical protein PF008_g3759 [Phytophthora fragariae]|uniref:Haloacid dehalogenase-like hydrolase domain-containing protein 3 n=1 Tax=Phytophthora fragariae TaxID=53985 RepID=A0A6G0SD96_9STRA|nr:hypothetical protein PF008_g3759 [Phytophthora fragariae]
MLLTLTFRVVHYGYDFTFDFPWIKKNEVSVVHITVDFEQYRINPGSCHFCMHIILSILALEHDGPSVALRDVRRHGHVTAASGAHGRYVRALLGGGFWPALLLVATRGRGRRAHSPLPGRVQSAAAACAQLRVGRRLGQRLPVVAPPRAQRHDARGRGRDREQAERFTRDLYAHYARPEAWTVFADVRSALEQQQVPLGVISNFDERLEPLLVALQLRDAFRVVTTSFSQPQMKPHAAIFESTFRQLQGEEEDEDVQTQRFLHVGDHPSRDYRAARAVGAHAKLLMRRGAPPSDVLAGDVIASLMDVQ